LFERPRAGERAVLVRLGIGAPADPEDIQEFEQLARSAGAVPVAQISGRRDRPDPRFFVGSGKADEIKTAALAHNAVYPIVDAGDMHDAVRRATELCTTVDAVVLSPACARCDMFQNFWHRGRVFRESGASGDAKRLDERRLR
jgi:hypothetical protein